MVRMLLLLFKSEILEVDVDGVHLLCVLGVCGDLVASVARWDQFFMVVGRVRRGHQGHQIFQREDQFNVMFRTQQR